VSKLAAHFRLAAANRACFNPSIGQKAKASGAANKKVSAFCDFRSICEPWFTLRDCRQSSGISKRAHDSRDLRGQLAKGIGMFILLYTAEQTSTNIQPVACAPGWLSKIEA
jgi:hypothetical protein